MKNKNKEQTETVGAVHTHTHTHNNLLKKRKNNEDLGIVDKEQSIIIRAICCLVVILVHIPKQHGNFIQDIIGSFGYIAVTLFFLFSSYGLKYSVDNKENYLKNFWKNRIFVLLVPFWITNIIQVLLKPEDTILNNIFMIIGIKRISFITILVSYYILFWMIYKLVKKQQIADIILCLIVFLYSILGKAFNLPTGWMVETMGFIYGIVIYYSTTMLSKLRKIKHFILIGISSLIFGILYLKYKNIYLVGTWLLRTILSVNLVLFLTVILNNYKINSIILTKIGCISYEIYLMHGIAMNLINNIKISSTLWIILCIILTILIAYILKVVDKKLIKIVKEMN